MNRSKIFFTLALLLAFQMQTRAENTVTTSSLSQISLATAGIGIATTSIIFLKQLFDKIMEKNHTIDETTLKEKIITAIKYLFGASVGALGTGIGVRMIADSSNIRDGRLPKSTISVMGLTAIGALLTGISVYGIKTIIDKILEENPNQNQETVREQINGLVRNCIAFIAGSTGAYCGLLILNNCDNPYFC